MRAEEMQRTIGLSVARLKPYKTLTMNVVNLAVEDVLTTSKDVVREFNKDWLDDSTNSNVGS